MLEFLPHVTALALLDFAVILLAVPVILVKKRDSTVAVAWCLVVLLVPLFGAALFWMFGFNYVHRRVQKKARHRRAYDRDHPPSRREAYRGAPPPGEDSVPHSLARLALAVQAFPVSDGNRVTLYHDTREAYAALLAAISSAKRHVHLQFFIFRNDDTGREVIAALARKAAEGVEVRLLLDSVGTLFLSGRTLRPLLDAGGRVAFFLPVNPLRSWVQVNLRNHRKIVVIDGETALTGGMNIGDEYLGKSKRFGPWRDTFLKTEGPGTAALQRVFLEDWDFATAEKLREGDYSPDGPNRGTDAVQVVESGPDQELNATREIFFAAILSAVRRVWIASPYFVPDAGLLDALRLARLRGVDVRLLTPRVADHFLVHHAGRYYMGDLLDQGGHVYLYEKGMMHAKVVIVDDGLAYVGSANMDNRSCHLNFEAGCLLYSPGLVADLDRQFRRDLESATELDAAIYAQRAWLRQLLDNACRLFSPVL